MHILVGLIGAVTGVALLYGHSWARIVGVVIASVSVIANFLWLPYYPLWAVIIIAFDLFVIWALTVSWQDIRMCDPCRVSDDPIHRHACPRGPA